MKNYDEVTNDLLERRDRYVADQKKKRKRVLSVTTSFCCFCLVVLLGFGMWQGGMFSTTLPDQTIDTAVYPGIKDDTFDDKNGESADNPAANNKIVIHSIKGESSDKMNICLLIDDFVAMTRDEMIAYYGVGYIPDIPTDIKPWEDERSGIYRRDGGTGDVYWDADILNYSNEDFTRSVHLEVNKGNRVLQDYLYFEPTEDKSVINNSEVMIGKTDNGIYFAEFMYKGVGFLLNAEGVTQDEFVAIIASILE